jgi:uncharacterized RDD family membrane protein YckC
MFCMLYLLYFVSKNLVLAETRKPASFPDYAGPFFLIWFFPIGIWFTQPRINRLYERPPPPDASMTLGIGYIMCGFTRKKQALHDMIAGCLVLRRSRSA